MKEKTSGSSCRRGSRSVVDGSCEVKRVAAKRSTADRCGKGGPYVVDGHDDSDGVHRSGLYPGGVSRRLERQSVQPEFPGESFRRRLAVSLQEPNEPVWALWQSVQQSVGDQSLCDAGPATL
ncbi:protein of unknown function [Candidatus Nitrospira inopinata]|uniref:Uncharacterized protein n=1 Tax=Candidatus Nitrospira inopinata TaxID=1715989 RepID=A0A0S4KYK4_9BACT|nr:protein of unknown function [Candidatus Nitrospira inopinata]